MQGRHLFEYSVIRIVPRVEREEFLNVGVIVYCADEDYLKVKYSLNPARLAAFTNEVDLPELNKILVAFEQICIGSSTGGPISKLPIASRFRWLTATRSTVIQTSPVHPGLCEDPEVKLQRLYEQLVG